MMLMLLSASAMPPSWGWRVGSAMVVVVVSREARTIGFIAAMM